jgi:uroporphyrinogen-III synthase
LRLLVTRPLPQGEALAQRLRAAGHEALICPLLTVEWLDADLSLDGVAALVFTSANGVAAFARLQETRGLPVFCVGDATARAAREAGFSEVESAEGNAQDLADLIRARWPREGGGLLHISGEDQAFDLTGDLSRRGFDARRAVLYRTLAVEQLPGDVRTALDSGAMDGMLFLSPRTAASFVSLCERQGLGERCRTLAAYCLSEAVAEAAGGLPWGTVRIAARPTQSSLLDLLSD